MSRVGNPVLFGYCMDLVLYGALTIQTYLYFLAFPQDRRITKSIVYSVYILGTLQTAFAFHDFYTLYCTEPPPPGTDTLSFLWFTIPFSGAVVAFIVQLFYANRIYVITKSKVVTALVIFLAAVHLLCGIFSAVCGRLSPFKIESKSVAALGDVTLPIAAASGTVCDLLIAIYTSRHLSSQMKPGTSKATQVLVTKIGRLLLETGTLTAGVAVIYATLAFLASDGMMITGLTIGKLYANSMLVVLNNRFTIHGGRNVPRSELDIPSYRRLDLMTSHADPRTSHGVVFTDNCPPGTTLPNNGDHMTGLNSRRGRTFQESEEDEEVVDKKAEVEHNDDN